jgi:Resolvase, N terminal domain
MANRSIASAVRAPAKLRCAIYTRKSSEEGLEQDFNSLDAQREACEAFIASRKREGWSPVSETYDDGGFSGRYDGTAGLRAAHAEPCRAKKSLCEDLSVVGTKALFG